MLKNLKFKPSYNSKRDDVVSEFYDPVLSNSILYKRASAYFSSRALSHYSKGLERFQIKSGKYQLVINQQIEQSDYEEMKIAQEYKNHISDAMLSSLKEDLSLIDLKHISNFAYLLASNVIELKIAFMSDGIFHDKFGFFIDEDLNILYFRGSNNETEAAIQKNYESFDITCSWMASDFDDQKVRNNLHDFELIWNNKVDNLVVLPIGDVIKNEILKFDKGFLIENETQLLFDSVFLGLNVDNILRLKSDNDNIILIKDCTEYAFDLERYVDVINENTIEFDVDLTYLDFIDIINIVEKMTGKLDLKLIIGVELSKYIEKRNIYIDSRRKVGASIKNRDQTILEKYNEYSSIVNDSMKRKLRVQQMWDSFFMFTMMKSSNFSVPGSGKTASVLGVYSFLKIKKIIDRIVVVGPKNSFDSWVSEFQNCFEIDPIVFNWQESELGSSKIKARALNTEAGYYNLILINYEALSSFSETKNNLINDRSLLVFDEVHKIKGINGVISGHARKFAKNAGYIIGLTGTPIPNNYVDIYNLLNILFKDEYRAFFGFRIESLQRAKGKTIKEINEKIFPFFCRTSKEDLSVPKPNIDIETLVCSNKAEVTIFNYICNRYKSNKLALLIRVLQLEVDPKLLKSHIELSDYGFMLEDIEDEKHSLIIPKVDDKEILKLIDSIETSSKLNALVQVIEELIRENKKVIIWCIFIHSIVEIKKRLNNIGIESEIIIGSVEQAKRREVLDEFRDGKIQVLVTNPHTLAESVSLHKNCHDAVYFEYSYNLVHLLQSKDRIHRLGLEENQYTQYNYLIQEYKINDQSISIGSRILARLRDKEDIMNEAIEKNLLEESTTSQEDLDLIFKGILD